MGGFLEQTRNRLRASSLQVLRCIAFNFNAVTRTYVVRPEEKDDEYRRERLLSLCAILENLHKAADKVQLFLETIGKVCLEKQILLQTGDIKVEKTRFSLNQHMNSSDQKV